MSLEAHLASGDALGQTGLIMSAVL